MARWILLWAAGLALASAAAPTAVAQGADRADLWAAETRSVTAEADASGFRLESRRATAEAEDLLSASYDSGAARLRLAFSATRPAATALTLDLAFLSVTEFRDADGDGTISLGDEVVRRILLPAQPAVSSAQPAGGGWRASAAHTLPAAPGGGGLLGDGGVPDPPGRFRVEVEALPSAAPDGRAPTAFAVRLFLEDVPRTNGTHAALEVALSTGAPPAEASVQGVDVADGEFSLGLAWPDGAPASLTGRGDPTRFLYTPSFPLGSDGGQAGTWSAAWTPGEPEGLVDLVRGNPAVFAGALAACAAAVAVPAWRRLRGRP